MLVFASSPAARRVRGAVFLAGLVALWGRVALGADDAKLAALPPLKGEGWTRLFDAKSLKGWRIVKEGDFAAAGDVAVGKGAIALRVGMPFTGIVRTGKCPTENFEIAVDAMRTSGADIFCGVTFPVGRSHVTMIAGGWGDTVVGLSNINDRNASDNETTRDLGFKNKRWYRFRIRVTTARIEAWIGLEKVIDLPRAGRRVSIYPELERIRPFGFFSWRTDARLRNLALRQIPKDPPLPTLPGEGWKQLFDGKTLKGWKAVARGEKDEKSKARVKDGAIVCEPGFDLTGVACTAKFPTIDYEVALDAMRVQGDDFFCGMTFPVGKTHATFIVGGWGGTLVGISNVDDLNASENETTRNMTFEQGRWYRIRLRVTQTKVEAWIGKDKVVDLKTKGHRFNVWLQQGAYRPFGINAWRTKAALRHILLRRLK